MADNVTINTGLDVAVAADFVDINSNGDALVQYMKIVDGTNGGTDVISGHSSHGLAVDVRRFPDTAGGVLGINVVNAVENEAYNLNLGSFGANTLIEADYTLSKAEFNFSTTQPRDISISTSYGTELFAESGNTNLHLLIDFEDIGFNQGDEITTAVSSTAGACTMDYVLAVKKDFFTGTVINVSGSNLLVAESGVGNFVPLQVDSEKLLKISIENDSIGIGGGIQFAEGTTIGTATGTIILGESDSDEFNPFQLDSNNYLQVSIAADTVGVGGGKQYTVGDTDASATGNVFLWVTGGSSFGPVSSSSPLPVEVNALTLSGGQVGSRIINSIESLAFDLNSSAFSSSTSLSDDFTLCRAEILFSTTQSRDIVIKTVNDVELFAESGNTNLSLSIDFDKMCFDGGDNLTATVTQTAGACSMDFVLVTEQGLLITGGQVNTRNLHSDTDSIFIPSGSIGIGSNADAINESVYDLNSASFSESTSITSNYKLGKAEFNFSSLESRDIVIKTNSGTDLYNSQNNTLSGLIIDFEELPFTANDDITIEVSQTGAACNMNAILTVFEMN